MLDRLEAAGLNVGDIAQLEWQFLTWLEHGERPPKLLGKELARNPRFFLEFISAISPGSVADVEPDEQSVLIARQAHRLLMGWKTPPGASDGAFDPLALRSWVEETRRLLAEVGRTDVGDSFIGHVLWYTPAGEDGLRPHEAVRDLIEDLASDSLEAGLHAEIFNSRGATTRDATAGGGHERELVARYTDTAERLSVRWRRVASIYRDLAASYEAMARRWDERAMLRLDEI
jgi:hypothetical protein